MKGFLALRIVITIVMALLGFALGSLLETEPGLIRYLWTGGLLLGGAILGFATPSLAAFISRSLQQVALQNLFAGIIGLGVSLLLAALFSVPISLLPGAWGKILPMPIALLFCYVGIFLAVQRSRELAGIFPSPYKGKAMRGLSAFDGGQVLVDTSTIIDGRIADISRTGFLRGEMLIPNFVLGELQHIADSSDPLRRRRGRRGLEMLNKLQKEAEVPVQIIDVDFEDVEGVDAKLVKLAKSIRCPIISNDFNLNRVAELQGVVVLNINELATAVKPIVLPGEEMGIRIIQEGKEAGQGVGFLDDGTMVVVEGGKRYINNQVDVVITRVLQTAVGRMVFAQLKNGSYRER